MNKKQDLITLLVVQLFQFSYLAKSFEYQLELLGGPVRDISS